jgi:hypothetical protein
MSFASLIFKKLKIRGIQVVLLITIYLLIGNFLPPIYHRVLFTISTVIKDLLIWTLPIVVGFFIAFTVSSFEKRAAFFILFILLFETFSNLCCVWYAYISGHIAKDFLPPIKLIAQSYDFTCLWQIPIAKPSW